MIICHYNDPHLSSAIASLKNQSQEVSIFLVDDGSRPEFKRVIAHFKGVKIEEIQENRGIGYARDLGVRRALQSSCDFVGFLDSDGVAHRLFVERAVERLKNDGKLLGVAAKKGLANPQIRIAEVKYRYKIYKKDSFQLDCSLFKAKAFSNRRIPARRSSEDSILLQSFKQDELSKLNVPYFHFERESISAFFRDEFYGAYYGYKGNMTKTFFQILITPYTSLKMVIRNHWFLEGLLFPVRQFVWLLGFLLGAKSER